MFDAVRAEALKIRSHRATWLMVWIVPIGFALAIVAQLLRALLYGPAVPAQAIQAAAWLQQSVGVWRVPLDGGGRFIIAGFAALVFAGEYGWNTWKLVVPARARWQLIAAKWLVASGFVLIAFAAASLLSLLGSALGALAGGVQIPPGVTASAILDAHATAGANAVIPILYTVAWAGLFAVLTGSLLATIALSIAIVVLEQLLLPIAFLAFGYAPGLTIAALNVLPFYHMANFIAATKSQNLVIPLGSQPLDFAWQTSVIVVLGWIAVIGAATIARFSRQDLN